MDDEFGTFCAVLFCLHPVHCEWKMLVVYSGIRENRFDYLECLRLTFVSNMKSSAGPMLVFGFVTFCGFRCITPERFYICIKSRCN